MGVENAESVTPADSTTNTDAAPADKAVAEIGAESSKAPEGEKFDLRSVVRDAVRKTTEGDAASPAGQDKESDQSAEVSKSEQEPKEQDNESFSDVPFHKHPRFKELVAQRDQYREGARQFEQVTSFLETQGITPEEAADMLVLRSLMKHDPQKAWAQLRPMVQQLLIDAGEVLPADLQQRVQKGEMTREAAIEFSRLRAQQTTTQKQATFRQEMEQRDAEARRVSEIRASITDWERETMARDPDFSAKTEALQKEVLWLQRVHGVPKTAADARKQAQTAYENVTKQLTSAVRAQQKPQQRPVTGGRVASGQPSAPPKSILEIVQRARAQG